MFITSNTSRNNFSFKKINVLNKKLKVIHSFLLDFISISSRKLHFLKNLDVIIVSNLFILKTNHKK